MEFEDGRHGEQDGRQYGHNIRHGIQHGGGKNGAVRHYPFEPLPLGYAFDALEPNIDAATMRVHYEKHYTAYVNNLNAALNRAPQLHTWPLEQLIYFSNKVPTPIRVAVMRNAGGVYNHEAYFGGLRPKDGRGPQTTYDERLFNEYKDELKKNALEVFGSGYAWLCYDKYKRYSVITTANQDTPITLHLTPILCIDVWEHAYYLKHYNNRGNYFEDWWGVLFPQTKL